MCLQALEMVGPGVDVTMTLEVSTFLTGRGNCSTYRDSQRASRKVVLQEKPRKNRERCFSHRDYVQMNLVV